MASRSTFSFNLLFEAWRHAKKVAVLAERRWIIAIERFSMDVQEEIERKAEMVLTREAARSMFIKAMNAVTSEAPSVHTTSPLVQRPE
ncbi:MAG: hypothetical protein EOO38_26370 [Cytophagaceae bacterium]|nr:MAG: hypothetical protein EOO38_26370 [Cytophagaceae bacterium]